MRKIPTIFERDWNGDKSRVTVECNPIALWVFNGEGIATRKYDGTAVLLDDGEIFCRYDAKNGKAPPAGFFPAQDAADEETGHWPGWVPAESAQHRWQIAAYRAMCPLRNGTYEACGPHFQGNPEHLIADRLIKHGEDKLSGAPHTFAELSVWFKGRDIEGIVWHHPDGRMAKIKKRDFGLKRMD